MRPVTVVHEDHGFIDLYDGNVHAANGAHRLASNGDGRAVRHRVSLAPEHGLEPRT
jgi:hypothetical protein